MQDAQNIRKVFLTGADMMESKSEFIGPKILDAIEEADAREDQKIICPICGNEIKMTRLGETCWEYICQTEGCIHERAWGL